MSGRGGRRKEAEAEADGTWKRERERTRRRKRERERGRGTVREGQEDEGLRVRFWVLLLPLVELPPLNTLAGCSRHVSRMLSACSRPWWQHEVGKSSSETRGQIQTRVRW
eukprot:317667-Rhodomonas_salina.1